MGILLQQQKLAISWSSEVGWAALWNNIIFHHDIDWKVSKDSIYSFASESDSDTIMYFVHVAFNI